MMSLPLGTVKSRINRARLEFKRRVEPMLQARRTNDPSVFWRASRGAAAANDTERSWPEDDDSTPGGMPT